MAANSLDIMGIVGPTDIAQEISAKFTQWINDRNQFDNEIKEIRDYVYATDTRNTSDGAGNFRNSVTTPKLTQIAQNLKANYMTHLFSQRDWVNWEAHNEEAAISEKRKAVESYMRTKVRMSNQVETHDSIIDDWIQTGNGYAGIEYVNETFEVDGDMMTGYIGPRLYRISHHDIAYNIAATNWHSSPKIVRTLKSLGELMRDVTERPELTYTEDVIAKMMGARHEIRSASKISQSDMNKSTGLIADGFSDLREYYNSDLVEILEFYGDFYDVNNNVFLKNHIITIADRAHILRMEPYNNLLGHAPIYHIPWRKRPENLVGMSPLANLIGMQHKIDKLENLRADVFDQIANGVTVEVGDVEFFGTRGAPGGRYVTEPGGSVNILRPDATALQADLQIQQTMNLMEEMAGSPREAMGFRSPGEKTKFEVQTLDNAANRIFREKTLSYERNFINDILNDMLAIARNNLDGRDLVRAEDSTFGTEEFLEVTRDDITAAGKLFASGSSHFEKQANVLQNLNAIFNSQAGALIAPHLSKIQLAKVIEDLLSAEQYGLIQENIGIIEDIQTQRVIQSGQTSLEEEALTDASLEDEEISLE